MATMKFRVVSPTCTLVCSWISWWSLSVYKSPLTGNRSHAFLHRSWILLHYHTSTTCQRSNCSISHAFCLSFTFPVAMTSQTPPPPSTCPTDWLHWLFLIGFCQRFFILAYPRYFKDRYWLFWLNAPTRWYILFAFTMCQRKTRLAGATENSFKNHCGWCVLIRPSWRGRGEKTLSALALSDPYLTCKRQGRQTTTEQDPTPPLLWYPL